MSDDLKTTRVRNWRVLVYPSEEWYKKNKPNGSYDGSDGWGSAPDDWKDILSNLGIRWACSPLHDMDIHENGEKEGKYKKPHWHITLCYSGVKSFQQVCDDIKELHSPAPKTCADIRGAIRYFTHIDYPEKFQYSQNDIESYGGINISEYFKFSSDEVERFVIEMTEYCLACEITEFSDFANYCLLEKRDSWFKVLNHSKTLYFSRLIASIRHKRKLSNNCDYENE